MIGWYMIVKTEDLKPPVFIGSVSTMSLPRSFPQNWQKTGDPAFSTTDSASCIKSWVAQKPNSGREGRALKIYYNRMVDRWTDHYDGECTFTDISHTTAISPWVGSLAAFGIVLEVIAMTIFENLIDKCKLKTN